MYLVKVVEGSHSRVRLFFFTRDHKTADDYPGLSFGTWTFYRTSVQRKWRSLQSLARFRNVDQSTYLIGAGKKTDRKTSAKCDRVLIRNWTDITSLIFDGANRIKEIVLSWICDKYIDGQNNTPINIISV